MKWWYRPCKKFTSKGTPYFCVVEYYKSRKERLWSKEPITPMAESKKELIEILEMMLKDIKNSRTLIDNEKD